jgi:hypothetical protein
LLPWSYKSYPKKKKKKISIQAGEAGYRQIREIAMKKDVSMHAGPDKTLCMKGCA